MEPWRKIGPGKKDDEVIVDTTSLSLNFHPRPDIGDVLIEHVNKFSRINIGILERTKTGEYEFYPTKNYRLSSDDLRQIAEWMDKDK